MNFDVHVASEVSESGHHIGDELCVVNGFIVATKVIHGPNKSLPGIQLHFVH